LFFGHINADMDSVGGTVGALALLNGTMRACQF
jgi:c-di-AMP phosphodiesterase-like protein